MEMGDQQERDEGGLAGVLVSSLNLFTDAGLAVNHRGQNLAC